MSALRLSLLLLLALVSRVESPANDKFVCTSSRGKKNNNKTRCTLQYCRYRNYELYDSLYWHCLTNDNTDSLDMADTELTNDRLRSLANSCRNLQHLDVSHNNLDSFELFNLMPALKFLDISHNTNLCNWRRPEYKDILKDTALVLVIFQGCQHTPDGNLAASRDLKQHFGFEGVLIYGNAINDEEIQLEVTTTPLSPLYDSDTIKFYSFAVGGGIVVIAVCVIVYYVLRKRKTRVEEASSTRQDQSIRLTDLQNRNNDEQEPGPSSENNEDLPDDDSSGVKESKEPLSPPSYSSKK